MTYYRPIPNCDVSRPSDAHRLAGGMSWFTHIEVRDREGLCELLPASKAPEEVLENLTCPRAPIAGLDLSRPNLMGILNVTPDSFSDGGVHAGKESAVARARQMAAMGADIIDIGGESTRPGASFVEAKTEIARTVPVIEALRAEGVQTAISIDTRKAIVARQGIKAGASLFNDVTALRYDFDSLSTAAELGVPVCLMHTGGDPQNMQDNPSYDHVLFDVYDHLADRIQTCIEAGISHDKVLIDPGIGFGKSFEHNLILLRNISLFHSLGCAILLGVSRKGFIGKFGNEPDPAKRAPGSIAVALDGLRQGVQILRVHDIEETRQAVALWKALAQ